MKKIFYSGLFFFAALFGFLASSCMNDPGSGTLTEIYLYPESFWGEWIRIDTGDTWYITSNYLNTKSNSSYYSGPKDGIVITKESGRVIKVTDPNPGLNLGVYYLYASRIANASFSASVVKDESGVSRMLPGNKRSAMSAMGGAGVTVSRLNDKSNEVQTTTDEDGNFTVDEIIPGDDYEVTVDGQTTIVRPNTDEDDVGTITIKSGANFKTSVLPQRNLPYGTQPADMMRLFSGSDEYALVIEAFNTGSVDFSFVSYKLEIPEELIVTAAPPASNQNSNIITGITSTIRPGTSAEFPFKINCPADSFTENFRFFKINIELTDHERNITWNDSVTLKFNREQFTINICSSPLLNSDNGRVSGVVIVPGAKAYHFQTSGFGDVYTASVTVPRYYRDDYFIIFSGANYSSEAFFSFAIDQNPNTNYAGAGTDIFKFASNNSESNAAQVKYTENIMAVLANNRINYFRIDMRD